MYLSIFSLPKLFSKKTLSHVTKMCYLQNKGVMFISKPCLMITINNDCNNAIYGTRI